jgi:FkbM family methyltransferase
MAEFTMHRLLQKLTQKICISNGISNLVSLDAALNRTAARHTKVKTVIDIGASNGCWSKRLRKYYPHAFCLLVEANPYHQAALEQFKAVHDNIEYVLAAAGDIEGEIYFDGTAPFGGLASHEASEQTNLKVPVTTIDSLCQQYQLEPPYLIKLDTHGFEVPIFEGAQASLRQASLLVVETYNFDIAPNSLRFPQMCQYLETKGFRCIDMCEPMYREYDQALWQLSASHLCKRVLMPECQPLPNKRFGRLSQIESCKTGMHPGSLTYSSPRRSIRVSK